MFKVDNDTYKIIVRSTFKGLVNNGVLRWKVDKEGAYHRHGLGEWGFAQNFVCSNCGTKLSEFWQLVLRLEIT